MEVVALNCTEMPLLLLTLVLKRRNQPGTTYFLLIKSQEGGPRGPWLFLQLVCALELTASLYTVQCS